GRGGRARRPRDRQWLGHGPGARGRAAGTAAQGADHGQRALQGAGDAPGRRDHRADVPGGCAGGGKAPTETEMPAPILFTDSAAAKVADLIAEEGNPDLKLRVFVQGGGCSGFQYGFTFDEITNEDDTTMTKNGVSLLIDAMSYQYLVGAE
ncbi:hypothetical protein BVRB_040470, partial [Beta vulgaris subsp. vulgaris]